METLPVKQCDLVGGSKTVLRAISNSLQDAALDSGMAMGMQTPEAVVGRLAEAVTHMKMAARWIDKFLKLNGLTYADLETIKGKHEVVKSLIPISPPPKSGDLDASAYENQHKDSPQRLPARATPIVHHHQTKHREDCSTTLFRMDCNCRALNALDGIEPGYFDRMGVWQDGYDPDVIQMGYDPKLNKFTAEPILPGLMKPGLSGEADEQSKITDDSVAETVQLKM